jgi:hypothetical protein
MSALCQKQTWARLTQSPHRRWKAISVVCLLAGWRRAQQVPVTRIAPQHQLISFVVERLRVPWRSEPAGVARPFIIAIAIDHGATRSQEAAVVEWPSSRNSVAHQRCLRCIECVAMSALPPKADIVEWDRHVRFVPKADIRIDFCAWRKTPGTFIKPSVVEFFDEPVAASRRRAREIQSRALQRSAGSHRDFAPASEAHRRPSRRARLLTVKRGIEQTNRAPTISAAHERHGAVPR